MDNLYLDTLFKRYEIACRDNELKLLLTHSSYDEKSNSRYVFLGQTAFRGAVGEWIFRHIAGTGMQLQHFWGNCFRQPFLETFFDKLHLDITRISPEIKTEKQRHIFIYALFGLIYDKASEDNLQQFVFQHIIEPNKHLLPHNYRFKNSWDMLIFLGKQHYDSRPKIHITKNEDKTQTVAVSVADAVIGSHQSISYTYARKRAIEKALKHIADEQQDKLNADEQHARVEEILRQKQQEEAQKAKEERRQKHLKRIEDHRERMRLHREKVKKEAQAADLKRRQQKKEVKEKKASRKGANSIYREYSREEIAAMSASKRRNLQDRGIIPKGLNF